MTEKKSGLLGLFAAIWRGVDLSRRTAWNIIFLILVFALVLGILGGGGGSAVPAKTALVLSPQGLLVEQISGDAVARAIAEATDSYVPEVLADDVLDAIAAAKTDDRVQAMVLDLDGFAGGGLDKLMRVSAALEDFKTSGKKVIAVGDNYSKGGYFLATAADEIYLHHLGLVLLDGYGRWRSYYKEGIDKFEIDWNIFKVGGFKTAVEPFLFNEMSDEAEEANREYMDDLWSAYLQHIANARGLTPEKIAADIENLDQLLVAADGSFAEMLLANGLVDHIGPRQLVRDRVIELVGANDEGTSFQQVRMGEYLADLGDKRYRSPKKGAGVGVVVARGTILNGSQSPGSIGGDSTAALIRQARIDDDVKAVVLRVDSGGGSAFASEVIRRELDLVREAGKPVVTSMGTVAASGGYWIATTSDEIWASPVTITGSIGIFAMFPTFQEPLKEYLGTQVDGLGTTWLSGAMRQDRKLDERFGSLIQAGIERGYRDFLDRVAEARESTPEEIHPHAQGRVWSGSDAHERGLVDQLGDLDEAVASAAALAGLEGDYAVRVVEKELEFKDRILVEMLGAARSIFGPIDFASALGLERSPVEQKLYAAVEEQLDMLTRWNDPMGVYAHCLCEVE
ncbi:MAG: signal peptide peptidase SppA [Acidobacteriota bacterium]